MVEFAGTVINRYEVGRDGKTPFELLRGKQSRLIGLEFGEKVNFRRTVVGARMAKLSGEIVVGTESGVFKTRTVQRKAYEHRWNKENMDMVGGVPRKVSPSEDSEEGIMPAVDIGMEMPEVKIHRAPKEDRRPVPRRLCIRAKDIDRHGVTPNCKGCIATLRGEGGVPHSDTCRKRLTDEIGKSDEGARAKRARQGELDFYERAVMESDHQAKRKFPAADEEDLTKRVRAEKESTTTFPVKGMYPAPHIHEHFTIHKWLRQSAYILTHNLNNLEHIANNCMNTTMHTDANISQF